MSIPPESGRRTRLSHEARRTQLVRLGVEMLRTRSLDHLSLEDVAAAAGISRGLPFHYFKTRGEFLVAVVGHSAEELLAATDIDPALPAVTRLRLGLAGYIEYIEANAAAYIALVRGAAGADDTLVAVFDATRERLVERIISGLALSPETALARLAIRGWLGMVEEATVSWLRNGTVPREELVWLLEESLLRIVATATDAPTPLPR